MTVAILTERKKNDVTFRGWRKVRLPVNYFVLITWLHMTSTLDRQCSLYTKRTCSIPEFVQENQWWSPEPQSRYWNQILCYQDQQQFTITGSVPPPKPKWTWTLKLWIPDPIWMFVVLQGCHSGRFTLQYILWKSSHLDSMTTSFPYLTYFPHAPEKKKPWSSWMHEYYVPKIVCLHFGSSQINGKGSIMYIPNIINFPHIYTKIWPWVMFWKLQWV